MERSSVSVRRRLLGGAGALVLLGMLGLQAPAEAATPPDYVALGDSYSSGTGTRSYLNDGTQCQRSTSAYPAQIAATRGYTLTFRACSGAVVSDVTASQLSVLNSGTDYVTLSIGGNDAGFTGVLTECAMPGWMSNCNGKIDTAQTFIRSTLPTRLDTLYRAIRAKAPNAKVVVAGYPRIFMGEDCNALTWFSPAEETRINATADQINGVIRTAATARGFTFANPTTRFIGHAVCDSPEWINGLSSPISESYHPNKAGHASGYTPLVSPLLTGAVLARSTAAARTSATDLRGTLTRQAARFAATDSRIKPKRFVAPDLTSPRARKAARKAGININRWVARHQR